MIYKELPSLEIIQFLLEYMPETGDFIRKTTTSPKAKIGSIANIPAANGYSSVMIMSKKYQAHRLAWFVMHGFIDDKDIDHINGNRSDNRINNLRLATRSENMQNLKRSHIDNKSNMLGAYKHKAGGYFSEICLGGQKKYLGYFKSKEEAHMAYLAEKNIIHPYGTRLESR